MAKTTDNEKHVRKYENMHKDLSVAGVTLLIMLAIMALYFYYG